MKWTHSNILKSGGGKFLLQKCLLFLQNWEELQILKIDSGAPKWTWQPAVIGRLQTFLKHTCTQFVFTPDMCTNVAQFCTAQMCTNSDLKYVQKFQYAQVYIANRFIAVYSQLCTFCVLHETSLVDQKYLLVHIFESCNLYTFSMLTICAVVAKIQYLIIGV